MEDIKKPLSWMLKEKFDLDLDCFFDISGIKRGRPVDTQGFIASNETTIVLSYRFTTSLLDWATNLSMSTSVWEPSVDEAKGHAGWCSNLMGCCGGQPRVHTGFYNNLIYTIPYIRQHVLAKLKDPTTSPKKVYVVGSSLGGAMSTVAYMFVLEEMVELLEDPQYPNHKLINVSLGAPRVCDWRMRDLTMERIRRLRPLDRAVVCRLMYGYDLVCFLPLNILRFEHIDKLVYITRDGEHVLVNPRLSYKFGLKEVRRVIHNFRISKKERRKMKKKEGQEQDQEQDQEQEAKVGGGNSNGNGDDDGIQQNDDNGGDDATATSTPRGMGEKQQQAMVLKSRDEYDKELESRIETAAGPVRDHMPYFYHKYLKNLKARCDAADERFYEVVD